jgi:hypothetical protein
MDRGCQPGGGGKRARPIAFITAVSRLSEPLELMTFRTSFPPRINGEHDRLAADRTQPAL